MKINTKFPSPNFSPRTEGIEYIILHYTEMLFEDALAKLTDESSNLSSHYLIRADGEILQLVRDDKIAWHAGESQWQNSVKLNRNSLGIELDNPGDAEFPYVQMRACTSLCHYLRDKYRINPANIIGHSDVSPGRKIDPGIFFDWGLLAASGIGKWHNLQYDKTQADIILHECGEQSRAIKLLQQQLGALGYAVVITGQLDAQTSNVIRAFQARFCPETIKNKCGMEAYANLDSRYSWDRFSETILQKLLSS